MILVIHILFAIVSIAFTTFLFFAPSHTRLRISYGLIAATLASGTYLVVTTPSHILQTCLTGLIYTAAVSLVTFAARQKLLTSTLR